MKANQRDAGAKGSAPKNTLTTMTPKGSAATIKNAIALKPGGGGYAKLRNTVSG